MSQLDAILVAAGSSRRMGFDKLTATLAGQPVFCRSLGALEQCPEVRSIVVVCAENRVFEFRALTKACMKLRAVVPGGVERWESVAAGAAALDGEGFVAVHDAARPLVSPAAISECFRVAQKAGAAALAEKVADTLHRTNPDGTVRETLSRENLWRVQTPQILKLSVLRGLGPGTDEVSVLLQSGHPAVMVENFFPNFKITIPSDLALAEALLLSK